VQFGALTNLASDTAVTVFAPPWLGTPTTCLTEANMAIKILKKTVNIELCHRLFRARLNYDDYEKYHIRVRYRSDQPNNKDYENVVWVEKYGFWMYLPDPWHRNVFGLSEEMPSAWESETVVCEMDFSPGQVGAFARDQYGGIMVLHNGDISGSALADGKSFFWQHYKGPKVVGGDQNASFAVVAHLGALDVAGQVRAFLEEVVRIEVALDKR
jgi:hypothetical protein